MNLHDSLLSGTSKHCIIFARKELRGYSSIIVWKCITSKDVNGKLMKKITSSRKGIVDNVDNFVYSQHQRKFRIWIAWTLIFSRSNCTIIKNLTTCSSFTLPKFFGKNASNCKSWQTIYLPKATWGIVIQIGSFLAVSHHPWGLRQVFPWCKITDSLITNFAKDNTTLLD